MTAQNHSVGRPRQRLAGFGTRPLLNFMERSVNGKPAVSKTATAGSSPACSAVHGTVAKKPRQRSAKPPFAGASPARVSIWGCGEIRITGRSHRPIPGAEPGNSTRLNRGIISRESALAGRGPGEGEGPWFVLAAMPKCRGAGSSIRFERVRVPSRPPIDCGDAERFGSRLLTCPLWVRIPPPQNFVPRWRNGSASLLHREGPCSIQGRGKSGLSVTAARPVRDGEAEVRLLQPGPYRRRSPTAEAPRSERGQ